MQCTVLTSPPATPAPPRPAAGSVGLCSDRPPGRGRRHQESQLQGHSWVPRLPLTPENPRIARQLDTTTGHHRTTQQNLSPSLTRRSAPSRFAV